jgi:hypothetical protein
MVGEMVFKKLAMAAALSLATVSTGAIAQSAPSARPLSLANSPYFARAGAPVRNESHLRGGYIIPALVIIAIGIAVWQLTKSHSP